MNTTDTPPLTFQPRKSPVRRARVVAVPPVLVAAACSEAPTLTLTFDRPIDVAGLVPGLFRVDNGVLGFSYVGFLTPTRPDPRSVELQLTGVEEYPGTDVRLTADAGNGIVAVEGGAAWAGVADVSLPLGE